jgi:folate receptor
LIETMWGQAFTVNYTAEVNTAYTMWWYEGGQAGRADAHDNPNDAVTEALGMTVPDQCHLDYFHKDVPSPEGDDFTECHPYHANACCHNATVTTPTQLRDAYGAGFEWDRCGPLSQACERFFVEEACFYECEPNAGLFRRFTDEQHTLCTADGIADGAIVTLANGASYQCVASAWGGNEENRWELFRMPISAAYADAWYRACANDLFCGDGNYFGCSHDYHARLDAQTAEAAALAANCITNSSPACIQYLADQAVTAARAVADAEAQLAVANAASATAVAALQNATDRLITANDEIRDLESGSETSSKEDLPTWAIAVIVVVAVVATLLALSVAVMYTKEKKGEPIFTKGFENKKAPSTSATYTSSASSASASTPTKREEPI